ncbi:MAG: glyoxalase/bleomycin resistance/dioxygenase family protein [Spirochaetes bacterium]|nr:glyoxalase/bleomycin resistance/dioxygenase family protein [Spirochaetota bacterium]
MKYICPLIVVEDIRASRDFYEVLLEQKIKYDFGENITFEGDFAIHLRSHFSELIDGKPIRRGSNGFELYFEHDNIENLVEKLKFNNVEFLHEAREQPWRQKVARFYDPDRHIIEIGESMEFLSFRLSKEGKSTDEISKIINMPVDFVTGAIEEIQKPGHGS